MSKTVVPNPAGNSYDSFRFFSLTFSIDKLLLFSIRIKSAVVVDPAVNTAQAGNPFVVSKSPIELN